MMKNKFIFLFVYLLACQVSCQQSQNKTNNPIVAGLIEIKDTTMPFPHSIVELELSESQWKARLDEETFYIMRKQGTERSFTGKYWDNHAIGIYLCNACQLPLFASTTKFESGTGWPSFTNPIVKNAVKEVSDGSHGMERTEVICSRCKGHLGHMFKDGPEPTGLRYCMNSASMNFIPNAKIEKTK